MRTYGYIPARLGSNRIAAKNLRLLDGRPLIAHVIETLRSCVELDLVVVNTESTEIAAVAREYRMESYMRPPELATGTTTTDEIVYDFLRNMPCDAVAVINPTAPFLRAASVDDAVRRFRSGMPSALFSVTSLRKHMRFGGRWLNVDPARRSPRTQDLEPVSYINFIISIFNAREAIERFERDGSFLYGGEVIFHEIPEEESFDIDYEYEFHLAEAMIQARKVGYFEPRYHPSIVAGWDYSN